MMASDPYDLFTRSHRLYVQGLRRAIGERLNGAFGESWWELGVWPALSESQRESLRVGMERERQPDLADYLDSGLFPSVVRRNHSIAFADAFPDVDVALGMLSRIAHTRNEWAHVPPDGLAPGKANAAVEAMTSVLASLRCREALEVNDMIHHSSNEPRDPSDTSLKEKPEPVDEDRQDMLSDSPLALWRELQSYLSIDSTVLGAGDDGDKKTTVMVRVSNMAPVGEGRPDVCFKEVYLSIQGRRGQQSVALGQLSPGQTVEREFSFQSRELVSVVFEVKGDLDAKRFFHLQRKAGIPEDVVAPLLVEFAERFGRIGINEPVVEALKAVQSVGPDMTLAEAGQAREGLKQSQGLIAEREAGLQDLFRDFHLDKETRLGAHCHEVWKLLRDAVTRMEAVDSAIGGTNPEAAQEAVHSLEELQMAILQLEELTRSFAPLPDGK